MGIDVGTVITLGSGYGKGRAQGTSQGDGNLIFSWVVKTLLYQLLSELCLRSGQVSYLSFAQRQRIFELEGS